MSETSLNKEKVAKKTERGKKSGRPRKTQLGNLDQLDGKVRDGDDKKKEKGQAGAPRSLDELMGFVKPSPYGTRVKEEFVAKLRDMNLSDMQAFAKKVGIHPHFDRTELMQGLIKSFCSYEDIKEAETQRTSGKNDITSLSVEAQQILKEGT